MAEELYKKILQDKFHISESAITDIVQYLLWRKSTHVKGDDSFGVVFITSKYCNLVCRHCAVNATFRDVRITELDYELSTQEIIDIFLKLHKYAEQTRQKVFFMFGGGEPTLREDFLILLKEASSVFGKKFVGFCTNGTCCSSDEVLSLAEHAGLLEVSLDGFQDYHNVWRPPTKAVNNPYITTMDLIHKAVTVFPNKLEVASVVTNSNMNLLPIFARHLRDMGVKHYSIHRPIAIGRMFHHRGSIPNVNDFILFFADMARVALEDKKFSFHLHHSLESIFSALLLGKDIHLSETFLGSRRHSIGIDSDGSVHFDPWAILHPFSMLSPGNLRNSETNIGDMLDNPLSILNLMAESKKANVRCYQCDRICSGGMRIAGIIESIAKHDWPQTLVPSAIVAALSSFDPACPISLTDSEKCNL